eukprot:365744-Chlamydomonas_euryale.AAC.8
MWPCTSISAYSCQKRNPALQKAPFAVVPPKKEDYETWIAYGQSKLCNILFARELQQRLVAQKANIVAMSLHPGRPACRSSAG